MIEDIIAASRQCQKLDYVWRYSTIPIVVPENVSTHSYWVTVYSAMIHNSLNPRRTDLLAACITGAIVHDSPETITGDIVRTFKYKTKELKKAIDDAEETVVDEFNPAFKSIVDLAGSLSKESGSPGYVKAIIKAADFLSLFNFMVREITRGNGEISPYYRRMIDDLDDMARGAVQCPDGGAGFDPGVFYGELVTEALRVFDVYDKKDENLAHVKV